MNETAETVDFEEEATEKTVVEKNDSISDEARQAFQDAINSNKDEDHVKIALIAAGVKFTQATKVYNELMVEAGLAVSKEEKQQIVADAVAEVDISTEEGLNKAIEAVVNSSESINEKSAGSLIRAYARKNEIEFFKKPKGGGGTRTTFLTNFYDALVENPNMTKEEAHEFMVNNGTANTLRWENSHQRARAMANRIAEKYS